MVAKDSRDDTRVTGKLAYVTSCEMCINTGSYFEVVNYGDVFDMLWG